MLDYGCGFGDLTAALSADHEVVGVDVDSGRVGFARAQHPRLRFEVCRPDGLDFPDKSFDVVLSAVVVHFTPDPAGYLKEARRVLRDEGTLVVLFRNKSIVRNAFRRWLGKPPVTPVTWGSRPLALFDWREAEQLVRDAGFEVVESGAFNDPLLSERHWKNVPISLVERLLTSIGSPSFAAYFGFLARTRDGLRGAGPVAEAEGGGR